MLRGLAVLLLAASAAVASDFEELPFVHFTTEHELTPLPSASVQKVMQDSQGFLWLGFFSTGLVRYDGHSLEAYRREDGLPSLTVREVVEDRDSYLWVGTESGLAVSRQPLAALAPGERVHFVSGLGNVLLPRVRVHRNFLAADKEGGIWVATRGRHLSHFRFEAESRLRERTVLVPAPLDDPAEEIGALAVRRDGSLWLGTTTGRLLVLTRGHEEPKEVTRVAGGVGVLHEGPSGTLWIGGTNGALWRFDDAKATAVDVGSRLQEWIMALLETPDGELWAASLGDGVLRLPLANLAARQRFSRQHGLLSNTVWSLAYDREGNLWFGQNGGLSRLGANYRAFGIISSRACASVLGGIPEAGSFVSLPDLQAKDGVQLWVGTGVGLLAFDQQGRCDALSASRGLISSSVYALARDWLGRVWVATPRGISVASFGAPLPRELANSSVSELRLHGRKGRARSYPWGVTYAFSAAEIPVAGEAHIAPLMWMAGAAGLVAYVEGRWLFFREGAGLPVSATTSVAMDDEGFAWVSTLDRGVFRSLRRLTLEWLLGLRKTALPGGGWDVGEAAFAPVWNTSTGAPVDSVHILRFFAGRVWAGTPAGLFALTTRAPFAAVPLSRRNGLGGENVRGLAVSPTTGTLWVSQGAGLAEVDPASVRVLRTVSKDEGLADNEAWAYTTVSTGRDGTVYLATPKGVAVFRPQLDVRQPLPPRVAIRKAMFRQDWSGENELVVEYAALTFIRERGVRFRTRLLDYEQAWSEPTAETRIRYTNLPAYLWNRTFVFEVTAGTGEDAWATEPARIAFTVHPAWWASWLAVLVYLALLGGALAGYSHLHSRRLRQHAAELEREVAVRTAQIRAQAAELETLDHIVEAINRQTTLQSVMQALLDHGRRLVPQAEKALFTVREPESGRFRVAAVSGWAPGVFDGLALTEQEALIRYSQRAEQLREGVFIVRDFEGLPGSEQVPHAPTPLAMLSMAVTVDGQLVGFVVFDNFSDRNAFSGADLQRLERFRQHAISAISKAHLLEELGQRTLEAQQANAAKSAFLARMSHELRTPLNSIIGFSDLLAERIGNKLEPRYQRFLQNISAAGKHLLGLINDILDLSKIEAGRMQLSPEPVAPRALAEGVVAAMKGVAAERHIVIELEAQENLPTMEVDPVRIKQVLFNLLSNAVKFSPDGAVVRLELASVAAEHSPVKAEAVAMRVIDRGIGIDPSKLDSIFEEFVQADNSTARRYGGTGLGLALVKRFVEMHRGVVQVESTPGLGSTFTVVLPCVFSGVK